MSQAGRDIAADRHAAALDWFVRQGGSPSPALVEEFHAWIEQSPENARAYADLARVWAATGQVQHESDVEAWRRSLDEGEGRGHLTRRALAAGLAAAVVGVAASGLYGLTAPKPLADQSFRTAVGQQATVTLPDGSAVTLNTDTIVRTRADKGRRLVYLEKGQAFFRVAKDKRRPFVVTAAGRTVTALGTAFDVRVEHGGLKVVLVEGRVRVESLAPRGAPARPAPARPALVTEMGPGSQLTAPDDADWRVTQTNVERETSWLNGQIVVANEPLGQVVEELNRYSNRKIVLADPALADTRVSGIFKPGDLDGFARGLKTSGLAQVGEETDSEFKIVSIK